MESLSCTESQPLGPLVRGGVRFRDEPTLAALDTIAPLAAPPSSWKVLTSPERSPSTPARTSRPGARRCTGPRETATLSAGYAKLDRWSTRSSGSARCLGSA
jgi:hypothetical protein